MLVGKKLTGGDCGFVFIITAWLASFVAVWNMNEVLWYQLSFSSKEIANVSFSSLPDGEVGGWQCTARCKLHHSVIKNTAIVSHCQQSNCRLAGLCGTKASCDIALTSPFSWGRLGKQVERLTTFCQWKPKLVSENLVNFMQLTETPFVIVATIALEPVQSLFFFAVSK